jgi:hypothetical protein
LEKKRSCGPHAEKWEILFIEVVITLATTFICVPTRDRALIFGKSLFTSGHHSSIITSSSHPPSQTEDDQQNSARQLLSQIP